MDEQNRRHQRCEYLFSLELTRTRFSLVFSLSPLLSISLLRCSPIIPPAPSLLTQSLKKIRAPENEKRSNSNSWRYAASFFIVNNAVCCSSFFAPYDMSIQDIARQDNTTSSSASVPSRPAYLLSNALTKLLLLLRIAVGHCLEPMQRIELHVLVKQLQNVRQPLTHCQLSAKLVTNE